MATKEVLDEEQVPADDAESVLSFWEDPANHDLIVNATPLDSLITEKMTSDQEDHSGLDFDQVDIESKESKSSTSMDPIRQTCSSEAKPVDELIQKQLPLTRLECTSSKFKRTGKFFKQRISRARENLHTAEQPNHDQNNREGYIESIGDLRESPACSVGKLFWCRKKDQFKIVNWSTAFYVGKEKIMTVAHVFHDIKDDKCTIEDVVFVPAMINQFDLYGKNFGFYRIAFPVILDAYRNKSDINDKKRLHVYDFVCVKLTEAKQLKDNSETPTEDSLKQLKKLKKRSRKQYEDLFIESTIEELGLRSIPLRFPKTEDSCFTVYGYGKSDNKNDTNSGNEMTKVTGTVIPESKLIEWMGYSYSSLIPINVAVRRGMSGGPWIQGDDKVAAGIQSERNELNNDTFPSGVHLSVSPNLRTQEDYIHNYGLDIGP